MFRMNYKQAAEARRKNERRASLSRALPAIIASIVLIVIIAALLSAAATVGP